MQVRELADYLKISPDTVRYYVRAGLISPTKNPENGYRDFLRKDIQRLRFVLAARQLGFSISDIKEILSVSDKGDAPCPTVRKLIEVRLAETEKQYQEISDLRLKMEKAVETWKGQPDEYFDKSSICHLIESFNEK